MIKRRMTVVLCLLVLATTALALGKQLGFRANPLSGQAGADLPVSNSVNSPGPSQGEGQSQGQAVPPQGEDPSRMPAGSIPQFAVYRQLFHHYAALKAKADEMERQGKNGAHLRSFYKRQAKLEDKQDKVLDKIASAVDAEVAKLDRQARKIINDERARHPLGKIARGQTPPQPPAELRDLAARRTQLILQGKKDLENAFGGPEFKRFDEFVQQHIAKRMKPVRFDRGRPEFPGAPETTRGPRQKGQATK
ncbi:MAG TPA: hypothetical protein VN256_07100 [Pyrinomonadaceae bacterium]|nr:hypothetical protein [Pyrinomonadaceae bacterium]